MKPETNPAPLNPKPLNLNLKHQALYATALNPKPPEHETYLILNPNACERVYGASSICLAWVQVLGFGGFRGVEVQGLGVCSGFEGVGVQGFGVYLGFEG